ncbi:MAG TPA: YggS family pyridoxal phosphate-dependent enzyme [Pseudacidobacterium sp.]|nr:YggS family pyridoxal phosphate-dependent enzyme [Pseudacidobacterium sp.]
MPDFLSIQERLSSVLSLIHAACRRAGRNPDEVHLMAVSKTHPAEAIAAAFQAGIRLFGENRVQEFQQKSSGLKVFGIGVKEMDAGKQQLAEVHLIGHLQSNKAAKAAEIFSAIDTVDSLRIAQRLNEAAARLNWTIPILLEIKLSAEETKTGLAPGSPELYQLLEHLPDLKNLALRGLMTVAPLDENPVTARTCFRTLRKLRDQLATQHPQLDFGELSMGMSGDFEIAIEEGSTLVRIGTAIFGTRSKPA